MIPLPPTINWLLYYHKSQNKKSPSFAEWHREKGMVKTKNAFHLGKKMGKKEKTLPFLEKAKYCLRRKQI